MIVFRFWHNILDMNIKDQTWHENDLADEIQELAEAKSLIDKWSELSDIVYVVTRTRWDGYEMRFPISKTKVAIGTLYMFPKMTGRWLFFYRAGKKAGAVKKLTEVRNPKKLHKLHHIAEKYDVDAEKFVEICKKQLKYWPLLK